MNKLTTWFRNHVPNGLFPILVVLGLIIVSLILTFFVYYKSPISLDNKKDMGDIVAMIKNQSIDGDIKNVTLKSGVIYVSLIDSIYKKSSKIKDENDMIYYSRSLTYDVVNDSDTIKCLTIFEIDEKFLKERVGKHLVTVKDIK